MNTKSTEKTIALFPGQGSQTVSMGKDLFEKHDLAKEYFQIANEALGFDLAKLCFEGPIEKLTETSTAQPAILTVSTIFFELAKRNGFYDDRDVNVVCALGHSLGEYSALVCANAINFADAVSLVNKRGKFMQEAVPTGVGKMVAVLGAELSDIEDACKKATANCSQNGTCEVANINANGQVVISGNVSTVNDCQKILADKKLRELAVSAPFHCSLMKPAGEKLKLELEKVIISKPDFPVYSNAWAKPLSDPEDIKNALIEQVSGTVKFTECVDSAVREFEVSSGIEFGNGKIITGLMKRINRDIPVSPYNAL